MGRLCCCFGGRSGDKGSKVEDAKVEAKPVVAAGDGGKKAGKGGAPSAVLVEFFTSQGCSSCPPADLIMSRLAQEGAAAEVPVLVLAYHVDIWDHLGWRDPFGSSAWSQRQRTYVEALQQDAIFTPQAVVQGAAHCVMGMEALTGLISSAKRFPAPDLTLSFSRPSASGEASSPSPVRVSGSVASRFKIDDHKVDVMLALYEDNLVTMCNKGENTGRTLTNDSVVRALEKLCTLENVAAKKSKHLEAEVHIWEGFTRSRAGAVVFLQNQTTKEVYGAQQIELPEDL